MEEIIGSLGHPLRSEVPSPPSRRVSSGRAENFCNPPLFYLLILQPHFLPHFLDLDGIRARRARRTLFSRLRNSNLFTLPVGRRSPPNFSSQQRERGAREPTVTKYSNLTALYPPQEYTHSARTVKQLVVTAKAAGLQDEAAQRW